MSASTRTEGRHGEMVACPDCEQGQVFAHVNRGAHGSGFQMIDCLRCKGTAQVPAEMIRWIVEGRVLKADRISRDMTLSAEAARRGMTPAQLSAMEHGRTEPRWGVVGS